MKKQNYSLLLLFFLIGIVSCNEKEMDQDADIGNFESYRYELWKQLIAENYQFDFIGTQSDNGNYADYLSNSFDLDHEGIGGIKSEGVLINLNTVLANIPKPDIVLLGIGINDLFGGISVAESIKNINQIIDTLQSNNPNVYVYIEQIAPASQDYMTNDLRNEIENFNSQIQALASEQSNSNSIVKEIDMYSDFTDAYFADVVHYNEQGAQFIANKYFTAIQNQFDNSVSLNILCLGDSRVQGNRP